jgi:hypothetical protein
MTRGHCCNTLFKRCEPGSLEHIVATMITEAIVGAHCCNWTEVIVRSHYCNNDRITLLKQCPRIPLLPCWCQRPWCGVENAVVISLFSKEYTFPILLFRRVKSWTAVAMGIRVWSPLRECNCMFFCAVLSCIDRGFAMGRPFAQVVV